MPEVRKLEFIGVSKNVDLKDLEANIYTTATSCINIVFTPVCKFSHWRLIENRQYLNRQELKRDVLRIKVWYYKHGWREAQVDTAVVPLNEKQVLVRFIIVEGPPTIVTDVTVRYDSTLLSKKRVEELTLIQKGEPLDLIEIDSTRVFFQNEMWELGYADALVDTSSVVDQVAHTAQVQIRIVPNHVTIVGPIVITGAEKVALSTVEHSLSFQAGDIYRRSAVIESQRTLYESNLFKLATIEVPQTFDSVKTVNVQLREAPLHEAHVGGGFNTVDYVQTDARYTHYNLFGGARRLDLSATAGNLFASSLNGRGIFKQQSTDTSITHNAADFLRPTWQASASLVQPAFLHRRTSLGIGAFAQRRSVPAVVIDRGYGGDLTVTHILGVKAPASATYRFEQTSVEANDPYYCIYFGVCETTTIAALRKNQKLSPFVLQAQVDRSDVPLAPTRGYTARSELEYASPATISDYRYFRAFAEASLYSRLGAKSNVLASHIRLGFVRPQVGTSGDAVLHPRKRFYAGGAQSVRGFGENQLGPRILTLPQSYLFFAKTATGAPCDASSPAIRFCDPATAADTSDVTKGILTNRGNDKFFTPRPIGGTSLLEVSVEYRFPIPYFTDLGGAVFIDGAAVGERVLDPLGAGVKTLADLVKGTAAITPGFGVRYYSSVGPIRVDVGYNPSRPEDLAVVTEITQNGKSEIIPLDLPKRYQPPGTAQGGIKGLLNRFTLHLSIGEAY
jgi:outer membrane protein insertion porin family/translocation and assembly module TamA